MIEDSLEPLDRLSVSRPLGCDPTGCGFNDPRTHKRHLVSLFHYPVFREHLDWAPEGLLVPLRPGPSRGGTFSPFRFSRQVLFDEIFYQRRGIHKT